MVIVARAPKPKGFKTWVAKTGETKRKWFLIDADGKSLGRLSSHIAMRLMGKDKPTWTPHVDTGDFVIVVNAEKIKVDDRKMQAKEYRNWSGFLGGLKIHKLEDVLAKHPERVVEHAVRLMLPKTLLAKQMYKKLKVYKGGSHPHTSQNPESWDPLN